jgi:hypothetical protein
MSIDPNNESGTWLFQQSGWIELNGFAGTDQPGAELPGGRGVQECCMQTKFATIFLLSAFLVVLTGGAATYSTEATVSLQKDEGTLNVDVRVSRLVEQKGKSSEQLITAPRIKTAPGVPATLYTGLQPRDPDYSSKENVTVEVSWPYPNESGTASCSVTVRLGNEIVSKSRLQLKIEGPGRVPLVVATPEVDPHSVRVVEKNSQMYVLFEYAGKTREAVKKLAVENYGNKVEVRDLQGRVTEGGLSFGTYHETGLALQYGNKREAESVAGILTGADSK